VGNETYSVEPVEGTLSGRHYVYKESDSTQPTYKCGMVGMLLMPIVIKLSYTLDGDCKT